MECSPLPPGPRLPAALQAAWLAYRPYRFFERCRDAHGEAFTIGTLLGRIPVFARPDYVEQIFALDGDTLLGGTAQTPAVVFAGEHSLMKLDGPAHRDHREILTSAFGRLSSHAAVPTCWKRFVGPLPAGRRASGSTLASRSIAWRSISSPSSPWD